MVGVISNWDIRLLELLQSMGLMNYVQHVSISALVGWEKPHSAIFEHALTAVEAAGPTVDHPDIRGSGTGPAVMVVIRRELPRTSLAGSVRKPTA